jgi:hypothetical protein
VPLCSEIACRIRAKSPAENPEIRSRMGDNLDEAAATIRMAISRRGLVDD